MVIILGIFYEGLSAWLEILEQKWRLKLKEIHRAKSNNDPTKSLLSFPYSFRNIAGLSDGSFGLKISLIRGGFKIILVAISYFLMLIAMTFNVGLFVSVLLGFAIGTILFSPVKSSGQLVGTSSVTQDYFVYQIEK